MSGGAERRTGVSLPLGNLWRAASGRFVFLTIAQHTWDRHLICATVTWRFGARPKYQYRRARLRRRLGMPEIDPQVLFPTRLRVNLLLYDPEMQRYRHMAKQSRTVTIETLQQWEVVTQALDRAIAQLNAAR
jgi:hypothetical protein